MRGTFPGTNALCDDTRRIFQQIQGKSKNPPKVHFNMEKEIAIVHWMVDVEA